MKNMLLLIVLGLTTLTSAAQQNSDALYRFEKQRVQYTKNAMLVLGGWSAVNLTVSAFATKTHNREMRYFHQMNVMWNSINLGFAAMGYWGAGKENIKNPTLRSVLKHQNGSEKTFLFNAGLDCAYIATGLYLTERSKSRVDPAKLKGYGNAIMFQGGFLLLFDGVNYFIHNRHGKKLNAMLDKVELSGGPGQLSLVCRL
jgi:hypothetical protein